MVAEREEQLRQEAETKQASWATQKQELVREKVAAENAVHNTLVEKAALEEAAKML